MFRLCLVLAAALIAVSASAQISQPHCADPANCVFPAHALVCPRGDGTTGGVVRMTSGQPCSGGTIAMQFLPPATTNLHPVPGTPFPTVLATVGATGRVVFSPMVGGNGMGGSAVYIEVGSGLVLGQTNSFNSPDLNGDGAVDALDMTLFGQILTGGSYEDNADFNLDGAINLSDLIIMQSHMGH